MTNDDLREKLRPRAAKHFDVSVPAGWVALVSSGADRLVEICPEYTIDQVKSKFGGLRFYCSVPRTTSHEVSSQFWAVVHEMEAASYDTCEVCGARPATQTGESWVYTLCTDHADL